MLEVRYSRNIGAANEQVVVLGAYTTYSMAQQQRRLRGAELAVQEGGSVDLELWEYIGDGSSMSPEQFALVNVLTCEVTFVMSEVWEHDDR